MEYLNRVVLESVSDDAFRERHLDVRRVSCGGCSL